MKSEEYTAPVEVTLNANQVTAKTIFFAGVKEVKLLQLTAAGDGAFSFNVRMNEENLFNAPIDIRAITLKVPYILERPVTLDEQSKLTVTFFELSGAANNAQVVFNGEMTRSGER